MFEYLKDADYQVRWYGKNDFYSQESAKKCIDSIGASGGGGHGGPDVYEENESGFFSFLKDAFPHDVEETGDMKNLRGALDFLQSWKEGDKPFIVFLPLAMPHPVYSAPQPYHDMYSIDDIPDLRPKATEGLPLHRTLIPEYRNLGDFSDNEYKKIQAVYLGMISCMDMMLGELLDTLDATNLASSTTVIASSDHGDWAGDYGMVEKWPNALNDVITRVPLIVRAPGNKAGHVVAEQVEMFDIMPSILELSGVECKHSHFAKSFVPQLHGAKGDPERAVFAEGGYDTREPNCFEGYPPRVAKEKKFQMNMKNHIYYPKLRQQQEVPESVCRTTMLRTLTHKLIYRVHDVCELYDLVNDPKELKNVYEDENYFAIRSQLEKRLLNWYNSTADTVPWDEDPRGFAND